jgi:hypothetical protein
MIARTDGADFLGNIADIFPLAGHRKDAAGEPAMSVRIASIVAVTKETGCGNSDG